MIQLLILADDFTGALDTGVRFAARGIPTLVVTDPACDFASVDGDIRVLVIAAGTRHLPPGDAARAVEGTVRRAGETGIPGVYIKTDSALRGNVGAELSAAMDALGETALVFAPAFPRINRVTKDGVQYIDGVPVGESVFSRDPFEPVLHSAVADILSLQTDRRVILHPVSDRRPPAEPGIHVYDAVTDADLAAVAGSGTLRLSAGCAGFADALADTLPRDGRAPDDPKYDLPVIMVCGSVNPVTVRQMETAEAAGFPRIRLKAEQLLDAGWPAGQEGKGLLRRWIALSREKGLCILDVNGADAGELEELARAKGLADAGRRERIAATLGALAKGLLDEGFDATLLCTGGDTLQAAVHALGARAFYPEGELFPGIVLTSAPYAGRRCRIITKSGGFGEPELLCELMKGFSAE